MLTQLGVSSTSAATSGPTTVRAQCAAGEHRRAGQSVQTLPRSSSFTPAASASLLGPTNPIAAGPGRRGSPSRSPESPEDRSGRPDPSPTPPGRRELTDVAILVAEEALGHHAVDAGILAPERLRLLLAVVELVRLRPLCQDCRLRARRRARQDLELREGAAAVPEGGATQSVPVSPPPMTMTCWPLAEICFPSRSFESSSDWVLACRKSMAG